MTTSNSDHIQESSFNLSVSKLSYLAAFSFVTALVALTTGCRAPQKTSSSATRIAERAPVPADADDPYLWLEDVTGEKALAWVRKQNAVATNELQASPDFELLRTRFLAILDSKERIPYISK